MDENKPVYLTESEIEKLLDWQSVNHVIEQSLISVSNKLDGLPTSSQPPRTFVASGKNGVLLTMPGYIQDYHVEANDTDKSNTLACKLVTSFQGNQKLSPPLPNILGTIFLFNPETGKLSCILEGTGLTAWRTASASLVATKHLYFSRFPNKTDAILAIIGAGAQGESHAIGMLHTFPLKKIKLWNRTKSRAEKLADKLNKIKNEIGKDQVIIEVANTTEECLDMADLVVTSTYTKEPLVDLNHLKMDVHINAIGAGEVHHSELSQGVYDNSKVFVDHWEGARKELATLKADIVAEVGEVILKTKPSPPGGITIYHSLGMAVQDAAIGQLIFEKYKRKSSEL